jgi:hypothetical protein
VCASCYYHWKLCIMVVMMKNAHGVVDEGYGFCCGAIEVRCSVVVVSGNGNASCLDSTTAEVVVFVSGIVCSHITSARKDFFGIH